MAYWLIRVQTPPTWHRNMWYYNGVPLLSDRIEFGDSPIRDRRSREAVVSALASAGVDFTVKRVTL